MNFFLFDFFTNRALLAPTLGCMLMSLVAAMMGTVLLVRKSTLIGEALSHASYPGVVLGMVFGGVVLSASTLSITLSVMFFGALFSLLGIWAIFFLHKKRVASIDSALCIVLSSFFGLGVLLSSRVQLTHGLLYNQVQSYLFGQAATMTMVHVWTYGALAATVLIALFIFRRQIEAVALDPLYAKNIGIRVKRIQFLVAFLVVLSVVVSMRSVGVVLLSGMLVAPPLAARQFSNRLGAIYVIAALIGMVSGLVGNYLSWAIPQWVAVSGICQAKRFITLPTGPLVFLVAAFFAFFALLFAPQKGAVVRMVRLLRFKLRCIRENVLKAMWKLGNQEGVEACLSYKEIKKLQPHAPLLVIWALSDLCQMGFTEKCGKQFYKLTDDGKVRATQIVRLHRLWEVYLVDYLGQGRGKVHGNAEKMEHIITPELEAELTLFLNDPQKDPHHSDIPKPERPL